MGILIMRSEVHRHYVLYNGVPRVGTRYKDIAVVEQDQFEVRIFEGDVLQIQPEFTVKVSRSETHSHATLSLAIADAQKECETLEAAGWVQYRRMHGNTI